MITRRTLLQADLLTGALGRYARLSAAAAGSDYRALVCIFLFGGNDSNNLVVPLDGARFDAYTSIRKALALGQQSLLAVDTPGGPFGFHAKLAAFKTLFDAKKLTVVANVGTLVEPVTRAVSRPAGRFASTSIFSFRSASRVAKHLGRYPRDHGVGRSVGRPATRAERAFNVSDVHLRVGQYAAGRGQGDARRHGYTRRAAWFAGL